MTLHPPTTRNNPYDPHIERYWGDFPTTDYLEKTKAIFCFVHLNIHGIKYRRNDYFETFTTKYEQYLKDMCPAFMSINEHNLDLDNGYTNDYGRRYDNTIHQHRYKCHIRQTTRRTLQTKILTNDSDGRSIIHLNKWEARHLFYTEF